MGATQSKAPSNTAAKATSSATEDLSKLKQPPPEYERYFPRTFQENPRGQLFPLLAWEVVVRLLVQ
jgi:hypothetical protein